MLSTFRLFVFLTCILVVNACAPYNANTKAPPSERLLDSDGTEGMVEDKNLPDPLEQHMMARRQVDPNQISGPRKYTLKTKPEEAEKLTYSRTLRLKEPLEPASSTPPKQKTLKMAKAKTILGGILSPPPQNILNVRIGEHPGKTRIVLDLDETSPFTYDLDQRENVLIVELPKAGWKTTSEKIFQTHGLLKSYHTQRAEKGGTILTVRLKKSSRIVMGTALGPASPGGPHRIVFDIAAN